MSRITYTPLVSDVRGKTGDIVFSAWKGRGTVRRRVTPANPNSAGQQQIRAAMALVVACWQGLTAAVKNRWDAEAPARRISGFNMFSQENIADERADNWEQLTPANADVEPAASVSAAWNVSRVEVTWDIGEAAAADHAYLAIREAETSVLVFEATTTDMSAEVYDWELELENGTYCVYLCANHATNGLSASVFTTFTKS
ncbi:MAG: hypothetical protein FJ276_21935 [Planctomycetes bacterium]|nr:hypothetical protein [Planctomycetota bacterium]